MTARLIVNADDFGLSPGANRGIVQAHVAGVVTSTSLMVRRPAAAAAAALGRRHPRLSVGLHLDLGEWELCDGRWHHRHPVVDSDDPAAVAGEAERQLERFVALTGTAPTHLDSHQHVHREEPLRSAAARIAARLGVPLRHFSGVRYCGGFYGQGRHGAPLPELIAPGALADLIGALPDGTTELACHPAAELDELGAYAGERLTELASLCDARVRDAVARRGARLCSFRDVPTPAREDPAPCA